MNSSEKTNCGDLIAMIESFTIGEERSLDFIRQMEGKFSSSGLDNDDKLSDLQYALAMFGAADREYDEKFLFRACQNAIGILRQIVSD